MIFLKYIVDLSIYPKVFRGKPPVSTLKEPSRKERRQGVYWIIMRTFTSPTTTGDYPLPDGVFKKQTNIMLCLFQFFFI